MDRITQLTTLGTAGAGGDKYWFSQIGGTADDYGDQAAVDSAGNVITVGWWEESGQGYNGGIIKHDPNGNLLWQKTVNSGNQNWYHDSFDDVVIDSSDNIYAVGRANTSPQRALIVKLNSSGVVQWQREYWDSSSSTYTSFTSVALDSNEDPICAGWLNPGGSSKCILVKYNSSGTLQWQRDQTKTGRYVQFLDIALDSSDNIFLTGTGHTGTYSWLSVVKYNSSGTEQWQKYYYHYINTYALSTGRGIGLDSSGNIYVTGFYNLPNVGNVAQLMKLNSSGVLQWSYYIPQGSAGGGEEPVSLAVASNGDCYMAGMGYAIKTNRSEGMLYKFNSSGTLQYIRRFGQRDYNSNNNWQFRGIDLDSTEENLYIAGASQENSQGQNDWVTLKLPSDGSLTGDYLNNTVSYEAISRTPTSAGWSSTTGSMSPGTPTQSAGASSYTFSNSSYTDTLTNL